MRLYAGTQIVREGEEADSWSLQLSNGNWIPQLRENQQRECPFLSSWRFYLVWTLDLYIPQGENFGLQIKNKFNKFTLLRIYRSHEEIFYLLLPPMIDACTRIRTSVNAKSANLMLLYNVGPEVQVEHFSSSHHWSKICQLCKVWNIHNFNFQTIFNAEFLPLGPWFYLQGHSK